MKPLLAPSLIFALLATLCHAQVIARTVCGVGGPLSQSVPVTGGETINAQTGATYTYQNTDCGKLVTHSNAGAIAATLPQANATTFRSGWFLDVQNVGAGTVTITPTISTIDGAATLTLATSEGTRIVSNGTNYFTQRGGAGVSGGGGSIPAGLITISLAACPAGWTEAAALDGLTLIGTVAANGDVGTMGGSDALVPSGTNTAPTFTGNSVTSSAVSAGTPAGTNSAPAFTGTGSQSTSSDSAGTPSGTVGAISISGSTAAEASHTHSVTAAGTNGTGTVTPLGTIAWPAGVPTNAGGAFTQGAISWPAGVPTNSAITMSGSTANESTHTHTYTQVPNHVHVQSVNSAAAGGLSGYTADTSTNTSVASGYSTANPTGGVATGTTAAGIAHLHAIGTVEASTPTISWPAGVPTIAAGSFTQPTISWPAGVPTLSGSSSTTSAQTFTGSPVISGAGSSHLHNFGTLTASTPTFTGDALGTHSHTFTATGTVAAPIFTGSALGTHTHDTTATGSVSAPTFTGNSADNRSAFMKVIFCSKL